MSGVPEKWRARRVRGAGAAATLCLLLVFAGAPAGAGPLSGGTGFVTLLIFDGSGFPVNINQGIPMSSAGATQLRALGSLEGEALLRYDPDPLAGYEFRLANPTANSLQGALVLGVEIAPTAGGPTGYAEFQVEYSDDGGGGLSETVQHTTFLTEDDNPQPTTSVVSGLSFAPGTITSESPLVLSAGPVSLPSPVKGDFFVELGVQLSFTLGPGDSVVFRGASSFPTAPPAACDDGLDMDGDGEADFPDDPGCDSDTDGSERSSALDCDDGSNGDGDGWVDFDPDANQGDPGCRDPGWPLEDPQCQDGLDNDGFTGTDFDGGASVGVNDPNGPDPQCTSRAWKNREASSACGLGYELAFLLPPLLWPHGRRRKRTR